MRIILVLFLLLPCTTFAAQSPKGAQTFPKLGTTKTVAKTVGTATSPVFPSSFLQPVEEQFRITNIVRNPGGTFVVRWSGAPAGSTYQLLKKTNVTSSTWQPLGAPTTSTAATNPITGLFAALKVSATPASQQPGKVLWVRGMTTGLRVHSKAVATDRSNNVAVVGSLQGSSANFGGGPVPCFANYDGFVAKYTPQGALLWAKVIGGIQNDVAYGVATDSQNNVFVAGYFNETANFGGTSLTSSGIADAFVVKYSPAGNLIWAKRLGGAGHETAMTIAVDGSDNVVMAATFGPNADFGGITLNPAGGTDIALVKLSGTTGATVWAKGFGGAASDTPYCLAVDRSGEIVITGHAGGPINLGGGLMGDRGGFVAKYSTDGIHRWSKALAVTYGGGITTDPATGNVIVSGGFSGTCDLGGGPLTTIDNGGSFLVAYSPSGQWLWNKAYGGSGDGGACVSVDGNGNLAITGTSSYMIDFGNGVWLGAGGYYVANYTISGNSPPVYQWAKRSYGVGTGIAFDSAGHVLTTGTFSGAPVDFGGITVAPQGAPDSFVAQYMK